MACSPVFVLPVGGLCSSLHFCCCNKQNQKQRGEGRVYLILTLLGHSPSLREVRVGSQGRSRKRELWSDAGYGAGFLDHPVSPWLTFSLLLYTAQDFLSRDGTGYGSLGPPTFNN